MKIIDLINDFTRKKIQINLFLFCLTDDEANLVIEKTWQDDNNKETNSHLL